ncbi:uncharacterized protein EDB91DRAFT_1255888 [Suillus paluster]|uniref:uncharacterized protein n=1 Tax=Suillus paluster TaxID=48578 RepID=UPI001B87696E|nr:uncharacterized protein EDB91DRAFT_1255888 [Suillus paluster]KAG1722834.1 hypothetical protein EDB91DRAFT_1255888 [Suillus paluster]
MLELSEKTTLTEDNNVFQFSNPQKGVDGFLQVWNNTGLTQDICMAQLPGFANRRELMPVLALYFNGVGDGSNATADFTPIPRVYITSDYQETAVLQSAIETPMIWEYNLGALAEITTWNLLT